MTRNFLALAAVLAGGGAAHAQALPVAPAAPGQPVTGQTAVDQAVESDPASDAVTLAAPLPVGFTFETRVTQNTGRVSQLAGSAAVLLHERTVLVTRSRVLAVDAAGAATIETEFRSLALRQEQGGRVLLDFNSEKGGGALPANRVYSPLIGSRYQARVAPDGRVLAVTGVREMIDRMLDALRREGVSAAEVKTARDDYGRAFGGARLREYFYSVTDLPPLQPVRVGEAWTRGFRSGDADLPLIVRSTGRIARLEGAEAIIYEHGNLALDIAATALNRKGAAPVRTIFKGVHHGGTRLDVAARRRTTRLLQRYVARFGFAAPSPGQAARRSFATLQGRTDTLIEITPVAG